ncbi:hypothetical protein CBR_g26410 [Chara braunii]|uniref:Single-stranded DNA binding protein Ssb-like OB fold domain-containing protein n=1 Tax=Chara braunii TaxID=69332 RepID=A0A388L811_CHABU|nr:hypothetical protein CBR_g26410 [Chara braunii]|eukprot:TRINITY_DN10574_c0_g1_i1.p1 TRINITY_DN10574_c0_g1~~TRINITY_DN10574_c0_g1_i1.p1  ORF type:complete len:139 (-),score=7.89 TRINITY_DN10574_c0_g1_i1:271-687(-)
MSNRSSQSNCIMIEDLRPSPTNNVNTVFIVLEKDDARKVSEGAPKLCTALVADSTAAVHLQLWGSEIDAFKPGDIVRLTNGIFSFHKTNLVLRAGKKGHLEKIGEFCMLFTEHPNMSRLQWIQDPNSRQMIPQMGRRV